MAVGRGVEALPRPLAEVVATATGSAHRADPVGPRTGGPAGNARLTAWIGCVLLGLFLAETATLISVGSLITWHIALGAALVPWTVAKTVTTGWRIFRYYTADRGYRRAGPPPMVLRVLGPLVIVTGLAVLGSGLALVALGSGTYHALFTIAGFSLNALTIHQACFVAWSVIVGLHVLARALPAWQLIANPGNVADRIPGAKLRAAVLLLTAATAVVTALLVVHWSGFWTHLFLGTGDARPR
jgi:hypothetical protein